MLVQHPDGTSTGDAFVIFAGEDIGKAALKRHRGKLGQRYVELFRSTQAELQQVSSLCAPVLENFNICYFLCLISVHLF